MVTCVSNTVDCARRCAGFAALSPAQVQVSDETILFDLLAANDRLQRVTSLYKDALRGVLHRPEPEDLQAIARDKAPTGGGVTRGAPSTPNTPPPSSLYPLLSPPPLRQGRWAATTQEGQGG